MAYNKSMHGVVDCTGSENPSNSERTGVIGNSKRGGFSIQAPGTKLRSFPSAPKGDPDMDKPGARYEMTPVRGGKGDEGKQTWPGARAGYETRAIPKPDPLRLDNTYQDDPKYGKNENKGPSGGGYRTDRPEFNNIKHGGGKPKQDVKDNLNLPRRGEAKQVAGISK